MATVSGFYPSRAAGNPRGGPPHAPPVHAASEPMTPAARFEPSPEPSGSQPKDPLWLRPPWDKSGGWFWFGMAFGGFLAGYVASALLLALFAAASGNLSNLSRLESLSIPPWWVTIGSLVGLWMGFVGAIVVASRSRGTGNPISDMGLRVKRWDPPIGIVIGVVGQLVVDFLYLPFEHIEPGLQHELSAPATRLTGGFHGADLAVIAVLTVVVVPVVEELFFRGLLLQSLVRLFRGVGPVVGPVLATVCTGILFGLAHAEPIELAGLALFGVALSVIAYRTGRLGICIFAHGAFNCFAVIAIAMQGRISA